MQFNDISITKYQQKQPIFPAESFSYLDSLNANHLRCYQLPGKPGETNMFFEKNIPWEDRWLPFKSVTPLHSQFQNTVDTYRSPRL